MKLKLLIFLTIISIKCFSQVDLGLPSGTKWAECNIGAKTPYEPGLYFQWGSLKGWRADQIGVEKTFDWDNYKFLDNFGDIIKYNTNEQEGQVDNKVTLELIDDAAYMLVGKKWRIPTHEQYIELINFCDITWVTGGCIFTSKIDPTKTLFFPTSGSANYNLLYGTGQCGNYWTSSLYSYSAEAFVFSFYNDKCYITDNHRYKGYLIRPVLKD